MDFNELIEVLEKGMYDAPKNAARDTANAVASPKPNQPKIEEPANTPESSNKDSNSTAPAQTPNNSGNPSKKPSAMDAFKDEGGYSGIAAEGIAAANKASETAGASMDQSAQRAAGKRQMRANKAVGSMQKGFNPALASLLAVAAGYASSDAFVSGAGGKTNDDITDTHLSAFSRAARKKKSKATTSRVKNIRMAYKEVANQGDLAKKEAILAPDSKKGMAAARAEIEAMREAKRVEKAHAPVPPIQGLVWDQSVKKWRKPENVGKTATEVQGKKRIRGSGLGQAGRSAGGSGSGRGRGRVFSGGRKGRVAEGDIGVAGKSRRVSSKRRRINKRTTR
jgi:hypothetical protein